MESETKFGQLIDAAIKGSAESFTVADISATVRSATLERDTLSLDGKIKYHLNRSRLLKKEKGSRIYRKNGGT